MKKILLIIIGLALASPAWSAQTAVTEISGVQPSVGALKTQVNTKLGTVESNRQDHETRITAMESGKETKAVVQASAPADTTVDWYDTDQESGVLILKRHNGATWLRASSYGVQYLQSCESIPAGMCVDTDDGKLYYHNGTAVVEVGTGGSGTTYTAGTGIDITGGVISSTVTGSVPSGTVDGQVLLWATDQWAASTPPWVTTASLGTGVGTWLATPSGANLASALTSALPASKGGTGLTSLGTGVGTALAAAVDGVGGLASKASLDALPNIIFGTGLTVSEDTPSAGTDTISVTANTYQAYDANMIAWPSIINATEVGYLNGLTEALSTSLAGKQAADADLTTVAGATGAGNSKYFGTNSSGTAGFYDLPTGGSGSFTFDTFPAYEDSAHSSGIAVNGTTLAVYSSTAGKWLTVGLTDTLDVAPVDTTPDAFTFADVTNATLSTEYTALAHINGIAAGITCSGSGGTVAACTGSTVGTCGTFGATSGSITNGQYVGAKVTSSANASTAANNVVTCGGVSDTFTATTGGSSTEILYPTGVGTYNEYPTVVGSTYCWSAVDESTYDDADNCQSDDGYDKQTFAWQNTSASSGHTITKVRFYARISNTAVLYVNNTQLDWFIPTTVGTFETKYLDYTTKPGGGAWTSADIDNIDAGFMANNNGAWVSQVYIEVFYE